MNEETTTSEQYTPPEGWQLVPIGEVLNEIYIRPIEIEPEPEAEPVQVREGRWRTRGGDIRNVTPTPEGDDRSRLQPWWDAEYGQTWGHDGRYFSGGDSPLDLLDYLGPIESVKTQELPAEFIPPDGWRLLPIGETLRDGDVTVRADGYRYPTERVGSIVGANQRYIRPIEQQPEPQPANTADELRSEVSHVQRLLGESRQRVTQLEELVTSLRTINAAQEKAVDAAGKENTALRNQLAVAKAELTTAAAVCKQLQIELDAAQQVPVDSPDLQQLRLRLADMTLDRDTCKDAYDRIFADLCTIKETTKAEAVEAIIEWLQHFRGCNSPSLALLLLEALPHIMRSLTGLNPEEIE